MLQCAHTKFRSFAVAVRRQKRSKKRNATRKTPERIENGSSSNSVHQFRSHLTAQILFCYCHSPSLHLIVSNRHQVNVFGGIRKTDFCPKKNDGFVRPKKKQNEEEWIRLFSSVRKMWKILLTLPTSKIGLVSCMPSSLHKKRSKRRMVTKYAKEPTTTTTYKRRIEKVNNKESGFSDFPLATGYELRAIIARHKPNIFTDSIQS